MGSTTLPRVPPTRQPVQRNEARFLLSRRAGRSFPSDLAYHPNSAVPGRFVSKRQGRFLSMASGPPRRLPGHRKNLRRQWRNTSSVLRVDWPFHESSSSGRRPMMCANSWSNAVTRAGALFPRKDATRNTCMPPGCKGPSLRSCASTLEVCLKNAPFAFRRIVALRPASCQELATGGCLKISACPTSFLAHSPPPFAGEFSRHHQPVAA
jgi:hypothetical protein